MSNSFFMVFLEGGNTPSYQHQTLLSAQTEAQRLCKLHNKKAYVLCTLKSYEINEFLVKDCKPEIDDLPF